MIVLTSNLLPVVTGILAGPLHLQLYLHDLSWCIDFKEIVLHKEVPCFLVIVVMNIFCIQVENTCVSIPLEP